MSVQIAFGLRVFEGGGDPVSVPLPSTADGDMLLTFMLYNKNSSPGPAPTGWTAPILTAPADGSGLVVLSVLDQTASSSGEIPAEVSFAVFPDADRPTRITRLKDGVWEGLHGPEVADLDDVGAALAGEQG